MWFLSQDRIGGLRFLGFLFLSLCTYSTQHVALSTVNLSPQLYAAALSRPGSARGAVEDENHLP